MIHYLSAGTKVTLSEDRLELAREVGEGRYTRCRSAGVYNGRHSGRGDDFVDVNGACGEVALLQLLLEQGLSTDDFNESLRLILDVSPKSAARGEDAGDLLVGGQRIDVKTTHYETGSLIIAPQKQGSRSGVHGFALMTGDYTRGPDFVFRGWLDADSVWSGFSTAPVRFGDSAGWRQEQLKTFVFGGGGSDMWRKLMLKTSWVLK